MAQPRSLSFWLGVGLGAVALIVGALGYFYYQLDQRFRTAGVATTATVAMKKIEQNQSSDNRYLLQFRFTDAEGKAHDGWQAVERSLWDTLSEGQSVDLTYLPSSPSTVRLAKLGKAEDGWPQLELAGAAAVVAVLCFLYPLARRE